MLPVIERERTVWDFVIPNYMKNFSAHNYSELNLLVYQQGNAVSTLHEISLESILSLDSKALSELEMKTIMVFPCDTQSFEWCVKIITDVSENYVAVITETVALNQLCLCDH